MEADNFSDLYEKAESDYALNALERLFGGIIPYLSGEDNSYNEVGTFLTPFIETMNMIVLGLAVIVGAYTFLNLVADTAQDGQVLGRSADTKNTFLRSGLAALAFLPIKGGLSVIQLLAFGIAIMGSGIANHTWSTFADKALDGEVYTSPASSFGRGDWGLRGKLGSATYAMVMGRLCELHMDRLAESLNVATQTKADVATRTSSGIVSYVGNGGGITSNDVKSLTKSVEWYYKTESGGDASNDICGSVKFAITYKLPADEDAPLTSSFLSFSDNLSTLAKTNVYDSVVTAITTIVRPRAAALADRIYSGNPGDTAAGLRNDSVVQEEIKSIAEAAALSIFNSRTGISSSDEGEVKRLQEDLAKSVTQNGWIMAPVWQRGLSSLHVSLRDLQTNLDLSVDARERIGKIFGTGIWGSWTSENSVSQAAFQPVERDMEYLASMVPYVDRLALADVGGQTSPLGTDAGAELGNETMQSAYRWMLYYLNPGADESANFKDPFMTYTEMGSTFFLLGSPLVAGGSIAEGLAGLVPVVDVKGLVGVITGPVKTMGFYLMAMGVVFMLIIPSIPILFFFSGVISWFALVIEAVFALPLALLLWLVPARDPSMIGPWNKVMVTLCGLLLRPFFIMVGMIACVLLLWLGNQILGIIFGNLLLVMTPGWSTMAIVMMFGLLGLYGYSSVLLALYCSSLVNLFGDAVMNWIGGTSSPLNRDAIGENLAMSARGSVPLPGAQGLMRGSEQLGGGINKTAGAIRESRQKRIADLTSGQ
jgi:conjugal transfer/type IV secretion protein DotA/TraY